MVKYTAKKESTWNWNIIVAKDGASFARTSFKSSMRESGGTIVIGPRELNVDRPDGWLSGEWRLCDASGAEVARIKKPKAMSYLFALTSGGKEWHLQQASALHRKMVVTSGAKLGRAGAEEVGSLEPQGKLTSKIDAVFKDEMPEEAQMLCIWMYYLMQRREEGQAVSQAFTPQPYVWGS
jgi:hypothetical protein